MNSQYKADISRYQKKDALTAIFFWAALMVLYAASGIISRLTGATLIASVLVSLTLLAACLVIIFKKGDGISSLGFRRENLWPSLGLGFLCGIAAIILNNGILAALIYGWELEPVGYLLYRLLYYLVGIALMEEMFFRGYIQTRLYGIFRKDISAVSMGALLFALMHAPFQLGYRGIEAFGLFFMIGLATTIVWHIAFNLLYTRYYSIYGPIVFHALMNWSNDIFVRDSSPFWSGYLFFAIAILILLILGIRSLRLRRRLSSENAN